MKKITATTLSLFMCAMAFAQQSEPAIAKAHYIFTQVNDTTQRDKFLRDEVVTYLGEFSSLYSSYSSTRSQEAMEQQLNDPAFDGKLVVTRNTTAILDDYLINNDEQSMHTVKSVAGDKFLLADNYPEQDWTISEETKTIGGYEVQKAECMFKGRDYTAWFTTELPFPAGPWKLRGLPGLILEAYDSKQEVKFQYAGFDKMEENAFVIEVPENALKSTANDVARLDAAFRANPKAYIDSKMGGKIRVASGGSAGGASSFSAARGTASSADMSKIKSMTIRNADDYKPSQVTNNPIELTQ